MAGFTTLRNLFLSFKRGIRFWNKSQKQDLIFSCCTPKFKAALVNSSWGSSQTISMPLLHYICPPNCVLHLSTVNHEWYENNPHLHSSVYQRSLTNCTAAASSPKTRQKEGKIWLKHLFKMMYLTHNYDSRSLAFISWENVCTQWSSVPTDYVITDLLHLTDRTKCQDCTT